MPAIDFSDLMPAQGQAPATAGAAPPLAAPPAASGGPLSFDDLMPQARTSMVRDVAQSIGSGLVRGVADVAGLPALLDSGVGALARQVPRIWRGQPLSEEDAAKLEVQAPRILPDIPGASAAAAGAIRSIPGADYQPQTTAGRYVGRAAEFVPGALGGPETSILSVLKYGVAPGLASEAAGDLTKGTPYEGAARIAAPILAGGGIALASRPGTAAGMVADAAGALDKPTLDAAQSLMDAATQQGTPISLAEAVQQVTGGGTRLGALQRVTEQSRGGADTMAKFYADRPNQVQQAGTAAIDRIGTVPAVPLDGSVGPVLPNTSAIGPGVQRAAQGAVDATPQAQNAAQALADAGPRVGAEQAGQVIQPALRGAYDARLAARSAQARQDYAAAGSDTIDPGQVQGILDGLDSLAASDKTGLLAPKVRELRNSLSVPAKPQGPQWEADPIGSGAVPDAPDMPLPPPEAYMDRTAPAPRPDVPRPQTLQQFVKAAGGVRDPGGDLKAMGLDQVPGLVVGPGKGFNPDQMRQAAAQAGYLGPNIDEAMANTTIGDLHGALASERPVHSVYDSDAVDAWNAHDLSRAEADQLGRGTGRSAIQPRMPASAYRDEFGPAATAEPQRVPITDIANLDRARKVYGDRIALPVTAPGALDKETAARLGPVLDQLGNVMEKGSPAFARAKANFRQNSEPLQPFEQTPGIARSIEQDQYGSRFMTPADQVPGAILGGGPSSARAFNSVAAPPARKALEDRLTTQILDQGAGSSGLIDTGRLTKAMRDNADTLAQYPAVQKRVQQVVDTQQALAPIGNTMVGRLAATPHFREQASIILDPNPVPGSAREVGEAVRQVAEKSPQAAQALVSQHIRQIFAETTQANMGGANQWGAAKFNSAIRGNSEQAQNLRAAVVALHGKKAWGDLQQTLDVFEAMGRRQAAGSQTAFNQQISRELQKGGKVGEMAAAAASPAKWLGKAQEIYEGWRYGKNTEALARFITAPDAAARLAQIAKAPKGSAQSQGMAAAYLLGTAAQQGERLPAR